MWREQRRLGLCGGKGWLAGYVVARQRIGGGGGGGGGGVGAAAGEEVAGCVAARQNKE